MSQYLILIFEDDNMVEVAGTDVVSAGYQEFMARNQAALRGGIALEPASMATSIRPDGSGGFSVTDGPFGESKEAVGGYFVVEAADLDEALRIAKEVPGTTGVEVRPVRIAG
ncbi:YciI family protein [Rathayibacter soli]|uniref:YciI family protein n=1 Tax=Rathayibacter soli TaxID=3144168 RepID=UPI0027E3F7B7|nr:YciI family protein [Glaciibacter superstes]